MNRTWTFEQLTGDNKITLDGYAAPFGRPRSKPVVEPGKELREKRVYYPGNNIPTIHIFGTRQDDLELQGRWMDKMLGTGSSEDFVRRFNTMIEQAKQVRISWGDLLSYKGWIKHLKVRWESLNECAWTLTCLIDEDELEGRTISVLPPIPPAFLADDIQTWLNEVPGQLPTVLPNLDALAGEVFDALDDAVASVTQFGGLAVKLANSIDNWESAAEDELNRLRWGLHQFKTAALTLQDALDSIDTNVLIEDRQAEDDIAWLSEKTTMRKKTNELLYTVTQSDTTAEKVGQSAIKTTYTALTDDTWESISNTVYGDPSGADKIRKTNGIKYGQQPQAGVTYTIPKK